ncbi:MAG: hypothetical protein EA345_07465 [Halomonas sp.]|nr:hypothetical protein [Halomonas sp.]TVP49187.1 MAG: hypothetical protein EA345_07465 [Halomonas sp.]
MMKKDSLKKLGILGVSFGLMASPLAFAGMEGNDDYEPAPQEEPMQDEEGSFNTAEVGQDKDREHGQGAGTEFEEEEEEFTYEEEEEEQDDWETPEQDEEDDSGW